MILAADRCRERSPNFYVADSISEVEGILNPRLGDVAMIAVDGDFQVWRLQETEAEPDGLAVLESNACEFKWVTSGGVVNVALFTAGDTDATSGIETAIAVAPTGGVVYFPAGTYRQSSTITVNKRITLLGPGTLLETTVLAPQLSITASEVVMDGLRLTGAETVGTWNNTVGVIQSRCNIIVDGDDCIINRVVMSEKSCGIKVTGDRVRVFQCRASNSWLTRSQSNFHLSHGYLMYDDGGGTCVGGTIEQCHSVAGYGQGIGLVGEDISVLGCFVTLTLNNGIYNSSGTRCKMNGNTVRYPHDNGITSRGSQNEIVGNTVVGILSATDSVRRGNVGIVVTAYDFVATVGSSEALYSTAMGADFNGFGNIVADNIVEDFSVRGLEIGKLTAIIYCHGTVATGNTFKNCGSGDNDEADPYAVLVYGHDHEISDNQFYSILPAVGPKTPFGILVVGDADLRPSGVVIDNNTFDGGAATVNGVYLFKCDEITVSKNRIKRMASHAIYVDDCAGVTLENNRFPGGDIFFDGTPSSAVRINGNKGLTIGFNVGATPTSGSLNNNDCPNISLVAGLTYGPNNGRSDYDWAAVTGLSPDLYQIKFNGALGVKRNAQAGGYSMLATDFYVVITSTGNCILPLAATVGAGRMVIVKSANGVTTTVLPAGSDNVDTGASDVLGSLAAGTYISDGGFNWEKV